MNVVTKQAALIRGIGESGFVARYKNEPLHVDSVAVNTSPRRIVIVAENGWRVNEPARKIEASVLGTFIKNARTDDSFAFMTALGPRKQ